MPVRVLYDGWPLVYASLGPAALHLRTLLACISEPVQALVALPGDSDWPLPPGVETFLFPAKNQEDAHLRWEQQTLPGLARRQDASCVHAVGAGLPLLGRRPAVFSPAGFEPVASSIPSSRRGLARRLRVALAAGGLSQARRILWPADLPAPRWPAPAATLPPVVHPIFFEPVSARPLAPLDLPEGFILYHGPVGEADLRGLLDAWSWAAPAVGATNPLCLVGLDETGRRLLAGLLAEYDLEASVRALPPVVLDILAGLYQSCAALFHPASVSPWGDPLRPALACGKPVVALENPLSAALAGPAAYLVPPQAEARLTSRLLGAALVTVVVEDSVSAGLSAAGQARAAGWQAPAFCQALQQVYAEIV